MTDDEAIAECERWFAYLERQKAKSEKLTELAAMARQGPEQQKEAQRQLRQIDRQPTVYDGAKLSDAVRHLVKHFHEWKIY